MQKRKSFTIFTAPIGAATRLLGCWAQRRQTLPKPITPYRKVPTMRLRRVSRSQPPRAVAEVPFLGGM